MKVTINWDSVNKKLNAATSTTAFQKKKVETTQKILMGNVLFRQGGGSQIGSGHGGIHTPDEVANQFASVLRESIASSGVSAGVAAALTGSIEHTSPVESDGGYTIKVYFANAGRPSLVPSRYGGIDSLDELYNNGVDHIMNQVFGFWHEAYVGSRTVITGAHFLEAARERFLAGYAEEYNVSDIDIVFNG